MKTIAQTYKEQFGSVKFPFKIYDAKGNLTYWENSNGDWVRWEYDAKGNKTYHQYSIDYWARLEYDAKGNPTYYEDSDDNWERWEYDAEGNETYHEYSDGRKSGTPKNSCINKIVEIDGKKDNLRGGK